ncbi:MAG: hypothetical protein GQ561_03140 [Calditrichae bacterium]|nr:hypothetical protein [Calditrichia bacterium]
MENVMNKNWWLVLLKGLVLILLAFVVFGNPGGTLMGISLFIGIGLIVTGLVISIMALAGKKEMDNWGWKLAEGLLDILFGFILIANPGITAVIIPFLIGFWATFYGILLIVSAFSTAKFNWVLLTGGILIIILGNVILFNPVIFEITISVWIGITLLLIGIANVVLAFDIKSIKKAV